MSDSSEAHSDSRSDTNISVGTERDFPASDDLSWQRTVDCDLTDAESQPIGDSTDAETIGVVYNGRNPDEFIATDTFLLLQGTDDVSTQVLAEATGDTDE